MAAKLFDVLTADAADPRRRTFHLQLGGHPSRFDPDDITAVFYDVTPGHVFGGKELMRLCRFESFTGTNAEVARAFAIVRAGGIRQAKVGVARYRGGRIELNGKWLLRNEAEVPQ